MAAMKKKRSVTVCPEISGSDRIRYEVGNLQGLGARERQEDSFTAMNALDEQLYSIYGLMFAICDGMGGMADGKTASETAVQCLRDSFSVMDRTGKIGELLKESVLSASEKVEEILAGDGGSTVVTGIILREKLYFASAGDSYLYLYRDGKLLRLNAAQNICSSLYLNNIRRNSTEVDICRTDPEAAALTGFLGMPGLSDVDYSVRPLNLRKGDIILACSDGIAAFMTEEDIIEALQWPDVQDKCKRLEAHIQERAAPNQDNYTAFIVKCI